MFKTGDRVLIGENIVNCPQGYAEIIDVEDEPEGYVFVLRFEEGTLNPLSGEPLFIREGFVIGEGAGIIEQA